jgi:hypothetical protein
MRVVFSSEATYQATAGGGSYGSLADLGTMGLIDSVLKGATAAASAKSGYVFAAGAVAISGLPAFNAGATAAVHTSTSAVTGTGTRAFYVNESGVMYYNTATTAPTATADTARTVTVGLTGTNGTVLNN